MENVRRKELTVRSVSVKSLLGSTISAVHVSVIRYTGRGGGGSSAKRAWKGRINVNEMQRVQPVQLNH